jgi:hypothetical protein
MLTESCSKVASRFHCKVCDYFTDKKSSFDKHLLTSKHIKLTTVNTFSNNYCQQVTDQIKEFTCTCCAKPFKSRVGLWKHKNGDKCVKKDEIIKQLIKENNIIKENETNKKDELIEYLMKEHADIKDLILEICKNGINNNNTNTNDSHNTHTNSHNKAFNLQFFLNETCKNAMNITDFVDSIKLQLSDLMDVGELGYVEGISNIIVKNLNNLDETIRPIHCTDKKRETFYVKDENKWEKDEENKKLNGSVKRVALKNTRLFHQYKEKYPDYKDSDSVHSDKYSKIVIESLKDDRENNDKVIKNISKVTAIKEK